MTTLKTTLAELKIGTIITYNDMANVDLKFVVLDTDESGTVNVMNLETQNIEPMVSNTIIDNKWTI